MLEQLSRAQLARLSREYMLAAHFNSRTGYAALQINHGEDTYKPVAIDNWVAVSPIYTQRMQQAMKLRGESAVETILKGMQLEVGMPHQYMDAGFRMSGPEEGEFWLLSCGPLREAEPRGEDRVRVMCHDIEDPTFDATAIATDPRARVRPIHRPPRQPADRAPHCHWRVFVDESAEPLRETAITTRMRDTPLARLPIRRPAGNAEPGGMDHYDGPLLEQLPLERFSHSALAVICRELAVQNHLLINSLWQAVADRFGEAAADAVAGFQMEGSAWMMSERLVNWLGGNAGKDEGDDSGGRGESNGHCKNDSIDVIERVLAVHPAFQPRDYLPLQVSREGSALRLTLGESADPAEFSGSAEPFELANPAVADSPPLGWQRLLRDGDHPDSYEVASQNQEGRPVNPDPDSGLLTDGGAKPNAMEDRATEPDTSSGTPGLAGLEGLVRGVDRRASVKVDGGGWLVEVDEGAEPAEDSLSVQIARGSVLYRTQLKDHIALLEEVS